MFSDMYDLCFDDEQMEINAHNLHKCDRMKVILDENDFHSTRICDTLCSV